MKLDCIKRILNIDTGVLAIKLQNDKYVIVYLTEHRRLFHYLDAIEITKRMEYVTLKLRIKSEEDPQIKLVLFEELMQLAFFCGIY